MKRTFRIAAVCSALLLGTVWFGSVGAPLCPGQEEAAGGEETSSFDDWAKKRFERYKRLAELGSPDGMCSLGYAYLEGDGVGEDPQKALEWLRKAAEAGSPQAMQGLGDMLNCAYDNGSGEKNQKEALKWYLRAFEAGNPDCFNEIGDCYSEGNGIERDAKESVRFYRLGTERGDESERGEARMNLGLCSAIGFGVEKDLAQARRLIRGGDAAFPEDESYFRAICLQSGLGMEKDEAESERLMRKAAEAGNPDAAFQLALGAETENALDRYLPAAEGGSPEAMRVVGWFYMNGYGTGTDGGQAPDVEKGLEWLRRAAEAGSVDAMMALGSYFWQETEDLGFDEGMKWYRRAAEAGNADAMEYLSDVFEEGRLTSVDVDESVKWLRKAADANNGDAACLLGFCTLVGILGIEKDADAGVKLLEKAQELGSFGAAGLLGELYERGLGVEKDLEKAFELYQKAYVSEGNCACADRLGRFYYRGEGTKQDREKAMNLFRITAIDTRANVCYDSQEDFVLDVAGGSLKPFAPASEADAASKMNALGVRLTNGVGVESDDPDAARKWFQIAALYGSATAVRNLAVCYSGEEEEKALELWTKLAEADENVFPFPFHIYYEPNKVLGVEQTAQDAAKWLEDSANQGSEKAKKALEILNSKE